MIHVADISEPPSDIERLTRIAFKYRTLKTGCRCAAVGVSQVVLRDDFVGTTNPRS
jgi:hypothetical protein